MIDLQGLQAPFLISWLEVWLFAFLGGLASAFIMIGDIDRHLQMPYLSKPLIGTTAGMAMALFINGNSDPPPLNLAFWAFVAALCSTPIITGFLVFISDQKRQEALYKSAQSKFIPWHKGDGDDNH